MGQVDSKIENQTVSIRGRDEIVVIEDRTYTNDAGKASRTIAVYRDSSQGKRNGFSSCHVATVHEDTGRVQMHDPHHCPAFARKVFASYTGMEVV